MRLFQIFGKLPPAEQKVYWQKLSEQGRLSTNRIWLGNTRDKGSSLMLKDAQGRVRMMLLVSAEGKAEIRMLDEAGKVSKTISPGSKSSSCRDANAYAVTSI